MAAGKFDLAVFLGSVGAEDCTQDLLDHGVDTLDQLATLTEEKLEEWNIYDDDLPRAITKAQRLIRSSDAVVQEELLNLELFVACVKGDCPKAENLIAAGANVNYCNIEAYHYTPLHISARKGHTQVVSMLLQQHGVNIEARDESHLTPLHISASRGHTQVVSMLLQQHGVNIEARDKGGSTPLSYAAYCGKLPIIKLLVQNGANVRACDNRGDTPLHDSAGRGHLDCVQFLVLKGADITQRNNYGNTPLHYSASGGHLDCVQFLVLKGADITQRNNNGDTPLHDSAYNGHLDCVQFLVLKGADITQRNNDGRTALDRAKLVPWSHDVVTYFEEIKRTGGASVKELSSPDGDEHTQTVSASATSATEHEADPEPPLDAVVSSDSSVAVDRSEAMDSLGTNVIMNITNLGAQGYPGTGKTSLLDLAMGKPAALTRNSTGCVDPPCRYLVTKSEQSAAVVWDHVTTEKMFDMLCSASKKVIEEGLPSKDSNSHPKAKNPTAVASRADSLLKDREHSTASGSELATPPEDSSTRELVDTTQPGPSPSLPPPPRPLYTIFPELLTQLANSGRSGVIFDSHWMMVTDCGGQPPFLDASVLFLRNSCLEIFPLKLNECLDDKSKFSFFIDGKPATIATSCLPLSNLQVIETLAKAVAAFQPPHTASEVESHKGAKFAIVGTFEDKKDECTETLDQKERILEKVLEPYKLNLVRSLQGKIILPVNAVTTDEVERKRYSESLQKLITHASGVTLKVEVKLRWFGFLLSLLTLSEKKKKPVLKLDECFKIGSSLEMDESETLEAIRFFHDIGVIMQFDTPKLENMVIIDAKPVLDKVSQLISVPFTSLEFLDKYYGIIPPAQAKERLQQHGRFDHELLEALKFAEPITTQMFLDILEHVKAVVAVNGDDKHEYFMPCALDYASAEQRVPESCSSHPPLVIRFQISRGSDVFFIPLPVGYLPVLIIFLLTKFPSEFSTGRDARSRQYRNSINLLYKKGKFGSVFIVECHLQLEVYFTLAEKLPRECLRIRSRILEAMHLTEERLRITKGSITKVDCFLCYCKERSAHISHVGEYNCELEGVLCEKTGEFSSCNDKCLHWIPQDQQSQTDEVDSGKQTAMPTHEDKPITTSTSVSTSKEACAKKDITSNTPTPTHGPRPTINELISMERRDGSRKKLEIIDEITSHKSTQCTDFAHKLLNHRSTVRKLQKNHTNDEEFIRAVLNNWLDRDDDDEQEESVPCSWEALIQCMNDAGLDGELVKVLRDNVPRDC